VEVALLCKKEVVTKFLARKGFDGKGGGTKELLKYFGEKLRSIVTDSNKAKTSTKDKLDW